MPQAEMVRIRTVKTMEAVVRQINKQLRSIGAKTPMKTKKNKSKNNTHLLTWRRRVRIEDAVLRLHREVALQIDDVFVEELRHHSGRQREVQLHKKIIYRNL